MRSRSKHLLAVEPLESRDLLANTAPVMDVTGEPKLNTLPLNPTGDSGTAIYDVLRRALAVNVPLIQDPDPSSELGIAVTAADTSRGTWQFTIDGGTSWQPVVNPSNGDALLLAANTQTRLRFVPQSDFTGTIAEAIHFRAWDQTAGVNGGLADTSITGGETPFSNEVESASVSVSPAVSALHGWGNIGDSISFGYQFKPQRDTDRAWVEQLDANRGIYFGEFQSANWGLGRDAGREFLWGGPRPADFGLIPEALQGMVDQVADGRVSTVLYGWGQLRLFFRVNEIYGGTLTGAPLEAFIDEVVGEVESHLQTLRAAGDARLILQEFGDALAGPVYYLNPAYSDPVGRQRMADAVILANQKLQNIADAMRIPVVKFYEISKLAISPEPLIVGGVQLDKTAIRAFQHNPADFFSDGLHPGTIVMGLHANMVLTAVNRAYGTQVPLLSEQEILRNALLSPDMSQTTYYDVSSFVHYNRLVVVGADEFEIFEGSTILFDPLQNDVDPEGVPLQLDGWTQPASGVVSQAPTGELIYTPTDGFNGTDTFTYQVSDSPLRAETGTVTIHVRNADPHLGGMPVLDLDAPNGVANQPYALSGTLFDPGVLDTHAVITDWGDGTSSAANVTEAGGRGTFSAGHIYTSGGRFRVLATITDNDGGTAMSQTELLISGSGIQNGALRVIGSATADVLVMQRRGQRVDVRLSGHPAQTYSVEDFSAVDIILAAGNDLADLSGIRQESTVRGGSGNDLLWGGDGMNLLFGDAGSDWLYGGRASDALIGGTGNDWLQGRQGNDILIGGQDQDSLAGDQGDDLVIGAWTLWDTDLSALRAIRAEWSSARTFDQRIANLSGTGTGPRLNDNYFLQPNLTVYNDNAQDTMIGRPGRDWFFADLDGQNNDDDQLWWLDLRKDRVTGA